MALYACAVPSTPPRKPNRYELPLSNMVGAMVVVLLFVLAFVVFRALNRDNGGVHTQSVDYQPIVADARSQHQLQVYAPPKLPKGWWVNAGQQFYFAGSNPQWALVINNGNQNLGIQEGLETPPANGDWSKSKVLALNLKGTLTATTAVQINGVVWSAYTNSDGYYALVRSVSSPTARRGATPPWYPETVVVYGTASQQAVQSYAASLRN